MDPAGAEVVALLVLAVVHAEEETNVALEILLVPARKKRLVALHIPDGVAEEVAAPLALDEAVLHAPLVEGKQVVLLVNGPAQHALEKLPLAAAIEVRLTSLKLVPPMPPALYLGK